ncbi:MAG: hypothetical protein V6Z78_00245 [Holosporaceae bacterium]
MLFQKTLFSVCVLFCVLTVMAPTTPPLGAKPPNPPESAEPQVGPSQHRAHKPAPMTSAIPTPPPMPETTPEKPQKQRKYYLKPEEKEGLKSLLNDEKVVEGLKQHHEENPKINLEQKIRAIVADPSGETLLTQKEAIALKNKP